MQLPVMVNQYIDKEVDCYIWKMKETWGEETEEPNNYLAHISGSLNTLMYLDMIKYEQIEKVFEVLRSVPGKMAEVKKSFDSGELDATFATINTIRIRENAEKEIRNILNK